MKRRSTSKSAEYTAALALLACGVLAIANLPRNELPVGWLIAWTAPAMFFGCLRRRPHRPWLRAIAASATQIAAFALALEYADSLSRPAILACTILPPLAFVIVRRRDADAALGLFLSFCVLLVGVILGGTSVPILAGYGLAACLSLRCETHLAARAASIGNRRGAAPKPASRPVILAGVLVAIPCLFAAFVLDRTLAWIPSPLRAHEQDQAQATGSSSTRRQTGLDDTFNLGGGGVLADLAGEQLVLVRTDDRTPTPTGLYLRSGFFAAPKMSSWETGSLDLRESRRLDHTLRRPDSRLPVRVLEVERFAGARNFVFVPPHTFALQAVPKLQIDLERMWLRQSKSGEQTDYAVRYQELPRPTDRDRLYSRANELDLLGLPEEIDRQRYLALMDEWGARGSTEQVKRAIETGLAGRCRYDRIDPVGPYRHTIDNFLFSDTDRRGYCMHFASAAALMLRLRGIPCRIGVGLYGGNVDTREPEARMYGSQHAHAWVEIPYEDKGWVVYDPTPPDERGRRMPSQLAPGDPDFDADQAAGPAMDFWRGLLDFVLQPWFLLLVLILAAAASMWPSNRPATPEIVLPRSIKTARRLLVRILRALATSGHLRQRGQTLEEFSASLKARERLAPAVADAFRSYQEVRFGGYPFDTARERQLMIGLDSALATEPAITEAE